MKLIEMEKVLSELCLSHKDIIYIDKNETAERIRKIPSIDIDPKRGEWIVHSNGKMCDCSVCNESYDRTFEYVDEWNFCPNCGAKMKGADDE